jgi:hypothetical protein
VKTPTRAVALLPYLLFLALAVLSWQRWIEPYVDSGRELMVPWRVASGERLYRDVRFYHGPLGPYLAAMVDSAAGRSLPARTLLAGAIALLHLEALRRLGARLLGRGRAVLVVSLAVAAAFFLRPGGCHLFPFSLDTALAVAAVLWALELASGRGAEGRNRAAGAALLMALLSRPEMGLAGVAALALEKPRAGRLRALLLVPLAGAAAVYALVSAGTPFETLRSEGWLALLGPPGAFRNVYAAYAGLDRPALRSAELALAAVVLLVVSAFLAAGAFGASRAGGRSRAAGRVVELAVLALLAAAALVALRPPERLAPALELFPPLVRPVPLALVAGALWRLFSRLRRREDGGPFAAVPDAVLYVAAFFGSRMLLAAGYVGPYNAFLLPLSIVAAAAALFRAADRFAFQLEPGSAAAALPRLVAGALLVFLGFRCAALAGVFRHPAWTRVETPVGALYLTEPVSGATRGALAALSMRIPPGTAVGFPETGFFNYALGLDNPLPQEQFFPGHLGQSAERDAIRRLLRERPDVVLYANVLAIGHGRAVFGKDYLAELDRAVRENFPSVESFGPGAREGARIGDPDFFVEIRAPRPP